MPMWREYRCERCGRVFTLKDVELSGRIICNPCVSLLRVATGHAFDLGDIASGVEREGWPAFLP